MIPKLNKMRVGGNKSKIPEKYSTLETKRSEYKSRAEEYARMSLPYVFPESTPRSGAANQHGFSGIGAQAVNHLANKLVITLFPPQRSFYRLDLTRDAEAKLKAAGYTKTDLAEHLSSIETRTQVVQDNTAARTALTEAMKHLIITGNILLFLSPDGEGVLQAIPLSQYVCRRDHNQLPVEIITKDAKMLMSFDKGTQAIIRANGHHSMKPEDEVDLYTQVLKVGGMFEITQSAFDIPIGKKSRVKKEKLPWIPLRWNTCHNEDYGRGLIEDHAGDFAVVEFLSESIVKGMILMADIKYLVKQGAVTDLHQLASSKTGEFLYGNPDDVTPLQLSKYADFTPISAVLEEYKKRIGQAFMLQSANRRNAERVTTLELRMDATEMETSLGGVYSHLAQTMQRPLAYLFLARISTGLGENEVTPMVLTGLEALGRVGDMEKISQFSEMMQLPASWSEGMQSRVNWDKYARSVASSLSMSIDWLVSEEEYQQQQQAAAQAQQQQQLAAEASKAAPAIIQQEMGAQE